MGILDRFTTIVKANINELLDKAEDPAKMVDQYLVDLTESLAEVKQETAAVMAEEKRTKRAADENAEEAARMEDLVGRRDYSRRELEERLLADGYSRSVTDEVVSRACEVGIIDDLRYGAAFARSKVASGWGRVKIERDLSRRGVDASLVPGWPDEFLSADDERERALALASRRRLTGRNDYQKLVRFLCGRGFPLGLSSSVAREVLSAAADGE